MKRRAAQAADEGEAQRARHQAMVQQLTQVGGGQRGQSRYWAQRVNIFPFTCVLGKGDERRRGETFLRGEKGGEIEPKGGEGRED